MGGITVNRPSRGASLPEEETNGKTNFRCEKRRGGVEGTVGGHCPLLWIEWSAEGPSKSVGDGHCAETRTLEWQHQLPKYGLVPCVSFPPGDCESLTAQDETSLIAYSAPAYMALSRLQFSVNAE